MADGTQETNLVIPTNGVLGDRLYILNSMNVIGCSDLNYCAHIIGIGGIGALLIMHVKLFIICKLVEIPETTFQLPDNHRKNIGLDTKQHINFATSNLWQVAALEKLITCCSSIFRAWL